MEITFPGGLKVQASYKGHTILTDQPAFAGGENSAPAPFDLFLASIGTCVGIYVKSFCEQRGIDTKNIVIKQNMQTNPQSRLISKIAFEMHLPDEFPEKYKDALVHAANHCAVKRHMMNPPEFDYNIIIGHENKE
ncbi:MAG: OsmC family protein [Bacteroidales bacterium]|nr:OsmC family protein [Bacteroidales bacterium]